MIISMKILCNKIRRYYFVKKDINNIAEQARKNLAKTIRFHNL